LACLFLGLHGVAQAVAEEVDGQDRAQDEQARRDGQPGRDAEPGAGAVEQVAPGGNGRLDAEAEKAQRRFQHDGAADRERGGDGDRADGIGQIDLILKRLLRSAIAIIVAESGPIQRLAERLIEERVMNGDAIAAVWAAPRGDGS